MKKFLWISVLLFCTANSGYAQNANSAEELYRQGKFSAALSLYEEQLKTAPNDPFLYYNIGNCYFKMGSRGLAIANYYRAFRLDPRDEDIRHNLGLALETSAEKLVPSGMPEILHKLFFGLSYQELQGLTTLMLGLLAISVCVWLLKGRFGRFTLCLLGLFILTGGWLWLRGKEALQPLAVVAAPTAELRSGPGSNFPASANLTQGHLLLIKDTRDDWKEVIVKSQGIQGWIRSNSIEEI